MIESTFYLSEPSNVDTVLHITGLAIDELEGIVGRFKEDHWRWPGQLKGEVVLYVSGKVRIRHHFNKKKLWENVY